LDASNLSEIIASIIEDLMSLGNHTTQLVLSILPFSVPPVIINVLGIAVYVGLVLLVLKVLKAKVVWVLLGTLWFLSLNIFGLADQINRLLLLK
jgi:hypothetical protein